MTHPNGHRSTALRVAAPGEAPPAETEFDNLPEVMWQLPGAIASSALAALHEELVAGMRRDAKHLPTSTLHAMQLERVAYYYVLVRHGESIQWQGYSPSMRDSAYKRYREASQDFTSALAAVSKLSPAELDAIVQSHTARLVAQVLATLPRDQAQPLYAMFSAALTESG